MTTIAFEAAPTPVKEQAALAAKDSENLSAIAFGVEWNAASFSEREAKWQRRLAGFNGTQAELEKLLEERERDRVEAFSCFRIDLRRLLAREVTEK